VRLTAGYAQEASGRGPGGDTPMPSISPACIHARPRIRA
jgi:hypothetical protein